jgi:hypothetical protein
LADESRARRRLAEIPDVFEEIMHSLPRISAGAILREWDMMNQASQSGCEETSTPSAGLPYSLWGKFS